MQNLTSTIKTYRIISSAAKWIALRICGGDELVVFPVGVQYDIGMGNSALAYDGVTRLFHTLS